MTQPRKAVYHSSVTFSRQTTHTQRLIVIALTAVLACIAVTAVATSAATLRDLRVSIQGIADLPGKRIATVKDTTAARFLSDNGHTFTAVAKIEGKGYAQVVGSIFEPEQYGIALPTGSPLREDINRIILESQKDGTFPSIHVKWFGAQ